MAGELRRLSLDMVQDVLREWLDANEQAGRLYEHLPPDAQRWAVDNGGGWEMLVPVLAVMRPEAREVAHSLLLDAIDTIGWLSADEERLSQPVGSLTNERSTGDGAEMDAATDERLARIEAGVALILDLLGAPRESQPVHCPEHPVAPGRDRTAPAS